jgi:putative endonuclease
MNNLYYIGITDNIDRRLAEHNAGKSKYTSKVLPFKRVFLQGYESRLIARNMEVWLKKQKSRKLIEKILIDGKINKIVI